MNDNVKVIPLGGLGEIGKNMTVIEYKNEIIVIDCGVAFPDEEMYGVDLIIPDVSYLLDNKDKVKGFFITHGHEDHIGALPYILKQINVPVYGTKLALGLIKTKLKEHEMLDVAKLYDVKVSDTVNLEFLSVEFIRNTHSIADSCSLAIHTPVGVILHTGDFKVDYTPIDGLVMDFDRISALGREGVLLLMADSTNVERKGYTISERKIGETLSRIFSKAEGRVIVATFASNIHRMQQIIDASIKYGRKVAFNGRSMENISNVAIELGYLHLPEEYKLDIDELTDHKSEEVTIITTGSQGESMASLARIAFSTHRKIKVEPNDLFIISASPIPGNDKLISRVIDKLLSEGAKVIYKDLEEVHVSGHACQEELKLIHTLVHPKYFMPVHGEYRHLKLHGDLAKSLGMNHEKVFIVKTGQVLELSKQSANISGKVKTGKIFVDGIGVGDVGSVVLRDRKVLAEDGMLTVVFTIERETCTLAAGPDIITRGFVYVKESEELIREVKEISRIEIERCLERGIVEWSVLKTTTRRAIERFLYEKTKRRPSIIPIIMEI
ncbi:ribonuclease J [Clostridium cylindrosporum]|uniref:Ribonuclease J n=1 Tax=Clostridium cylindrosporum DSM 605 TaxID=1121307 RepID=A0A0J8DGA1_CLOCY|nr:ribonuclease J [Clostridium cylindrosporum]KMT23198.1 ribonuclease J1 [Clostridium cylindrosporum DSM 605]